MFRTIDCATWSDPWFAELQPDAKLLFLYLFTNQRTTPCGACELSLRQIAFDTGLDAGTIIPLLESLSPKVVCWPELNIVWLRNFYRRQAGNSNRDNYAKAARNSLSGMPPCVVSVVVHEYPELTIPIPIPSPSHPQGINSFEEERKKIELGEEDGIGNIEGEQTAQAPHPRSKPRQTIPSSFELTDELTNWALAKGFDFAVIERETEKFRLHYEANGKPMKDWAAAWRNWMVKVTEFSARAPKSANGFGPKGPDAEWFAKQARDLERQGL
jgi:hypothetical protein